jgi:hypothetical protein
MTSQVIGTGSINWAQVGESGLVSGLTAGLTNGITFNGTNGIGFTTGATTAADPSLASLASVQNIGSSLVPQAGAPIASNLPTEALALGADATISAGVQTAIEGGSFLTALQDDAVSDVAAAGAYAIGNAAQNPNSILAQGSIGYDLAHAALGCAAGAAEGTGCASGAIGGAASAALNPVIDANGTISPAVLVGIETLLGAGIAGALGYNVQGAATAAQNETLNNWLNHVPASPMFLSDQQRYNNAVAACGNGDQQACATANSLQAQSQQNATWLANACAGGSSSPGCKAAVTAALNGGNTVQFINGTAYAFDPDGPAVIATGNQYQYIYSNSFDGQAATSTSQGLSMAPVDLPFSIGGVFSKLTSIFGLSESSGVAVTASADTATPTIFNGIELNPNLPPPVAGYDYSPNVVLSSTSENTYWSHWTGYQGEISLANTVASLPNETVVLWGDAVGTNGNDIVSVNGSTGQVTLWDSKYASATGSLDPSTTFTPGSNALTNAIGQAEQSILQSGLSDSLKQQALSNLRDGNFVTNTVGSGGLKNSVNIKFCGGNPC